MPKRDRSERNRGSDTKYKLPSLNITGTAQIPDLDTLSKQVPYKNVYPVFSLRYFDHTHSRFSVSNITDCRDFHRLFERLKSLSGLTWLQIEQSGKFHTHEIEDWGNTSEKSGFEKLGPVPSKFPAYQFKAFAEFRVIGFFIGCIYYIVWLDRDHKLYPRR